MSVPLPDEVYNILNLVNTHLRWVDQNKPKRSYSHFHPSAMGRCIRRMQYAYYEDKGLLKGEKIENEPRIIRLFETGFTTQSRWEKYFTDAGVLRGIWECTTKDGKVVKHGQNDPLGCFKPDDQEYISYKYHEISIKCPEFNIAGSVDMILDFSRFDPDLYKTGNAVPLLFDHKKLPKNPIVLDMKTMNGNSFKSKLNYGIPHEYNVQMNIYINILNLDYGILIFENKDDSDAKIFQVNKDPDLWETVKKQTEMMIKMHPNKVLPPPKYSSPDSTECKKCEYREKCANSSIWNNPDLQKMQNDFYGKYLNK